MDRRAFLKWSGLGAASLSAGAGQVMAGPFAAPAAGVEHFVPADKKLAADWVAGLYAKGGSRVCRGRQLETIGMPIGGVAAGQVYLLGDGRLGYWEIFNARDFTGYGATNWQYRIPDRRIEQGFAIIATSQGRLQAKRLSREDFPGVEFTGEYPIGRVRYADPSFPVEVEMEAFSPFIPLNARDSALPATLFHLSVENTSSETVAVNVLGWLENAVCFHSAAEMEGRRRNQVSRTDRRALLLHTVQQTPASTERASRPAQLLADFEGADYGDWKVSGEAFGTGPASGTLPEQQAVSGFQGKGLVNTFLGKDGPQGTLTSPSFTVTRRYLNFLVGGGNHKGQTCINLLVDGKVMRTATGRNEERLRWHSWNVQEFEGQAARLEIVDRNSSGWGHINVDQIELADTRRAGPSGPITAQSDYGSMALALEGRALSQAAIQTLVTQLPEWRSAISALDEEVYSLPQGRSSALAGQEVRLEPKQKRSFTFVLSWHFPNRPEQRGQAYANWFKDAAGVADYVLENHERLAGQTRLWHQTYYDSTLPHWLLDRIGATVCNLATGTCQWWKNGRFWGWEGVGCCQGTCTHVWNYEHALARLFPELERSVRQLQDFGEGFDENSGLVGFRSNRAYAADGQCGTVLKAYREHLVSPDNTFLKRNWPRIKQALQYSIRQDANDDGLIENSQHNTYDINFQGPNTFVGSLYLAALRAGEEMARTQGEEAFADQLAGIFESGKRLSEERLWNGEYYVQRVDLEKHPKHQYGEGCLSDHLFGQGWAHQVGLGYIYAPDRVKRALRSVWKYNWAPDVAPQNARHKPERWFISPGQAGLFTCTWPKTAHLSAGVRYRNEVWTGIEYQVAGHMIWEGLLEEGLAIMKAIHDRYDPAQHNPYNEIECGDHYARAMASWGAYLALAGFEYHGPKNRVGFAPRISPENFRAAFTTAEGWGTFEQTRKPDFQTERLSLRWGRTRLQTLSFALPPDWPQARATVSLAGQPVAATGKVRDGRLTLELTEPVTVRAGQTLEVNIQAG